MSLKYIKTYQNEAEYRADSEAYNYSKIKDWTKKTPKSWAKLHIDGNSDDEKISDEMKAGSLLDCKLLESDKIFDEKYCTTGVEKKLTPNNQTFLNNLYQLTLENTDK